MFLSKCALFLPKFIKEQKASGLTSSLGIKTPSFSRSCFVLRVFNKLMQCIERMK